MATQDENEPLIDNSESHLDDAQVVSNGTQKPNGGPEDLVRLSHRLQHDKSILAIAVSSRHIYAGTEGGEILV